MDEGGASSSTCSPDYLGECEALSAQYLVTNLNIPHKWFLETKYAVPILNRHIGIGKNRMASDPRQVFQKSQTAFIWNCLSRISYAANRVPIKNLRYRNTQTRFTVKRDVF